MLTSCVTQAPQSQLEASPGQAITEEWFTFGWLPGTRYQLYRKATARASSTQTREHGTWSL